MKSWSPAFAGMTCLGFGAGLIGIYGFFVEPLSKEFGVGVAALNLGPVALLLVPGIVAPMIGKLADRTPIRRIIFAGASLAMLSLLAISQAPSIVFAGLGFLCFALGLTMYGPVVINGLMVKIYPENAARALAIAAMGISLATMILPPVVGALLAHIGWRWTLACVACGLWIILALVVLAAVPVDAGGARAVAVRGQVGSDIYHQPAYWLIGLCVALGFNVAIILAICYPPHFISQGYSLAQAGWFVSSAGLAGLAGKTCMAWLADAGRHYVKWLAAGLLLLQTLGLAVLLSAGNATEVILALCFLGFGGGAFIPIHPYLNSRYFDAAVISQVNGAQMPLFLPFGLVGAPLAGYAYDQSGNYNAVLLALAVTLVIAASFALWLPAPKTG